MTQMVLFAQKSGKELKKEGMKKAADKRPYGLAAAREYARELARIDGEVSADEVSDMMEYRGIHLGNAAGSIFKEPCWIPIGFRASKKPSAHARIVRVWKLKH